MDLKDMTDLIRVYDAYKRLDHVMDLIVGRVLPEDGTVLGELYVIEDVIARNSVLYQRDCKEAVWF